MKILIGEISSYKAIVIARYIRANYPDVELCAYDNKPIVQSIHTRYVKKCVRFPFKSLDLYISEIADYVRKNKIDVILPVHSDYIGAILLHKDLFGHALDWVGNYEDYVKLHEKDQLMDIANSLGVRVPKTYKSIEEAKVPFVIKPTNLSSAKGVRYYNEENQKNGLQIGIGDLCQEYIAGTGCGYEVYCRNGQILVEYGHIRLAEWPISGGSSVLRSRYMHPDMRPIAEKILSRISWTGFAMFEFKETPAGELVLIEVNPRIWGSINQALQDGCPLFETIISNAVRSSRVIENPGIRTSLIPQVWLAMIGYMFHGQFSKVSDWLRNLRKTKSDVSFWTDPKGLFSMIIRKIL